MAYEIYLQIFIIGVMVVGFGFIIVDILKNIRYK